ncbi:MAG: OmpP1/FadL family transporter, partial [Roseibacillus sp.]
MRYSHTVRPFAFILAFTALGMGPLLAVGFRLPNQDPMGIARGNAFVATADNPSAIYYNPAGITQLEGHQLSAGLYFITTNVEFESLAGVSAGTDKTFQAVPQIHYVYSPGGSKWSFGLGVYAPYGLGIDYGKNTPFNTVAESGKLLYASINPVAAYQFTDTLSLAVGLTLNYSEATF